MTTAGKVTPDWATFAVEGPAEVPDERGRVWLEWSATVEAG
jgi:hypothetical protein